MGGGEIEPPPEEGFVKAKLTIELWGLGWTRDPYPSYYIGFYGTHGKLSPQLYNDLSVASLGGFGYPSRIDADGPFYYNGIKYQGNETGDGSVGTPARTLWDEWISLEGQTVDVWLKS